MCPMQVSRVLRRRLAGQRGEGLGTQQGHTPAPAPAQLRLGTPPGARTVAASPKGAAPRCLFFRDEDASLRLRPTRGSQSPARRREVHATDAHRPLCPPLGGRPSWLRGHSFPGTTETTRRPWLPASSRQRGPVPRAVGHQTGLLVPGLPTPGGPSATTPPIPDWGLFTPAGPCKATGSLHLQPARPWFCDVWCRSRRDFSSSRPHCPGALGSPRGEWAEKEGDRIRSGDQAGWGSWSTAAAPGPAGPTRIAEEAPRQHPTAPCPGPCAPEACGHFSQAR